MERSPTWSKSPRGMSPQGPQGVHSSPTLSACSPGGQRRSPRLAAQRAEAARKAAKLLAEAVRDRVWCEARSEDDVPYYYSLQQGTTAWELPPGAILRTAGRGSLCPRPGDRIHRSRGSGASTAGGGREAASAS